MVLRLFSIAACGMVVLGFAIFAFDEADKGSREQVQRIEGGKRAAAADSEARREREQGPVAEAVDDVNDVLRAPFEGVTGSRNVWVQHLVPTGLALLVYGFGIALLANVLPPPRLR